MLQIASFEWSSSSHGLVVVAFAIGILLLPGLFAGNAGIVPQNIAAQGPGSALAFRHGFFALFCL
jgi:hypothetical protein